MTSHYYKLEFKGITPDDYMDRDMPTQWDIDNLIREWIYLEKCQYWLNGGDLDRCEPFP